MSRFRKGESGNPAGRPRGSRNKFAADFVEALAEDFAAHGAVSIQRVREASPAAYLRVISQVIPKEIDIQQGHRRVSEFSDEELLAIVLADGKLQEAEAQ